MYRDQALRAHVDFSAPRDAILAARRKGGEITVPPDEMSHPATGHPCRVCRWRPDRGEDELGSRTVAHLELFVRFMEEHRELKALLMGELVELLAEAERSGRTDLVDSIRRGAASGW